MATLKGATISETYPLLLKIASSGVDGTLRNVEDGDGTASALQISSSSVNINGELAASDAVTFAKSTNGDYKTKIYNANAGTATESNIYITNSSSDADGLFAGVGGTGFTTAGGFVQDGAWIGSGTGASGGLSLMTRASADMRFYTNGHTNLAMTIDSSQNVGIDQTSPSSFYSGARNLVIGNTSQAESGLTIVSSGGASSYGEIFFADGTTGNEAYRGFIQYNHDNSTDSLLFGTAGSEKMRIDSSGNTTLGTFSMTNPNTTYKQLNVGGFGVMHREAYDAYVTSNAYYNTSNAFIAKHDHSDGIGTLNLLGGTFNFNSYSGSVTAGTAYTTVERMNLASDGTLSVSNVGTNATEINDAHTFRVNQANSSMVIDNVLTSGNPFGLQIRFSGAGHGVGGSFIDCYAGTDGTLRRKFMADPNGRVFANNGITFDSGLADTDTLDDYEEGTWSPIVNRITTAPTVSYSSNRYGAFTKVGNMVFATFDVTFDSISGGSGSAILSGLPFTVSDDNNKFAGYSVLQQRAAGGVAAGGSGQQLSGFAQRNAAYLYLQYDHSGTSGYDSVTGASWASSGRFTGYIMYIAA